MKHNRKQIVLMRVGETFMISVDDGPSRAFRIESGQLVVFDADTGVQVPETRPAWWSEADRTSLRHDVESSEKWREWTEHIPAIPMQQGWRVQVLPPYAGALARFTVINSSGQHKSVYLDVFGRLGCGDSPYWEVCPVDNDVARCDMNDVAELAWLIEAPRGDETQNTVDRNTGEPAGPLLLTEDPDHR